MKIFFSVLKKYPGVILTCCYCYSCINAFSQIVVSNGGAPLTIVQSFVGAGLAVSNIQLNCGTDTANAAYGVFSNGSLGLGLSQGIVLSTGTASNLIGPNLPGDSATTGSGSHNGYQDPQLLAIAGDTISDLCILEFDVVPRCNSLQIKFVFGSEEYPEYVNAYNDAFGFFVTGPDGNCNPGFYDNTNVAKLPDGTPITVNNVNDGFSYGCPSALPGPCQNCSYYINNCNGAWVEYDGFTTVITVNLSVCPCAMYHWKFAIADTRDALYDSGVMIETFACQHPLFVGNVTSSQQGCTCAATATVNIIDGTPPYTFLWSTGATTQTVTGLCAGNYSVQVTDVNSCAPQTRYVTIEALEVTTEASSASCHDVNNGTASAIATGGTPPYFYVWNTLPPQTTSVATGLPTGVWQVTVTDSLGCTSSADATVLEADIFTIQLPDSVYTTCQLNNASLAPQYVGATPPLTYLWNTIPPSTSDYVSGLGPGVYTVTATDANGCVVTASSTVLPSDHITTTGDTDICEGGLAFINVHGASYYGWSPPYGLYSTSGSSQNAHPAITTTYTIIGYCANGPFDTAYVTVTVQPNPVVTASPATYVCYGNDVTLQATGALHYDWEPEYYISSYSSDSSSIIAHPIQPVNFSVVGYNAQGCSSSAIIPVYVPEDNQIIVHSTGSTIFCEGGQTTLYVNEQGNYLWSTGATTSSIVVTESGAYSVTVTDVHGCSIAAPPVLIVVYPAPPAVIVSSGPTEICTGSAVSLDLSVSQADHYLWSTLETSQSIHVSTPGTYSVTVTDNRNCTATESVAINMHNLSVVVNIYGGPQHCDGDPVELYAVASGAMNFQWSDGSTDPSILVTSGGTYTVTVTDNYSCSVSASRVLAFNPVPEATVSPTGPVLICSGVSQTLQANPGPGYLYQWYKDNQALPGETNQQLTTTVAGTYYVRVTNAAGCSAPSFSVDVIEGTGPEVSVNASSGIGCRDNVIYTGYGTQNVTLTTVSSAAVSYLWSTGETTQTISVASGGIYSVTAYDAAGCPSLQNGQSQITVTEVDIRCGHNLQKVVLCHVPEGNTANPQTICIAASAIPAHLTLHQYDCLGPCPQSAKISSGDGHEVTIYPNPAGDELSVIGYLLLGQSKIEIYDVLGQIVFSQQPPKESGQAMANSQPLTINISSLPKGIYFLRIYSEPETVTQKFVKAD